MPSAVCFDCGNAGDTANNRHMNVVDDVGDDVGDDEELFEFAQTHPLLFCSVCCIKDPGRVDRLAYEYWRNLMRERGLRS